MSPGHVWGREACRAIAALPIALGLHQVDETFGWRWLQGHVNGGAGRGAMWIYLLFALIALPTTVPLMVLHFAVRARRRVVSPFVVRGVGLSAILLEAMLVGHPDVVMGAHHLFCTSGLRHGVVVTGLYVVATGGPMLVSGFRPMEVFGWTNLVAAIALALLCASGFTSLWCLDAATPHSTRTSAPLTLVSPVTGIRLYSRVDGRSRHRVARAPHEVRGAAPEVYPRVARGHPEVGGDEPATTGATDRRLIDLEPGPSTPMWVRSPH